MPPRQSPSKPLLRLIPALVLAVLFLVESVPVLADSKAAQRAYESGNFREALKAWLPLAEAGNAEAQFRLGELYANGEGVPRDFAVAHSYYLKAALQGHPEAQWNAGDHLNNGVGERTPEQRALGFILLLRAATAGQTAAYVSISGAYCFGEGVEEDPVLADVWMVLALGPLSEFRSFMHCDVMTPLTRQYHAEILRRAEGLRLAYGLVPYGSEPR